MQVAGRAAVAFHRALNETECVVECAGELRRHYVAGDGCGGGFVADALGEFQHEVVGLHPLGDVDQVAQQGGASLMPRLSGRAGDARARAVSSRAGRPGSGRASGPPRR